MKFSKLDLISLISVTVIVASFVIILSLINTEKPPEKEYFEPEAYTLIEESTEIVSNFPGLPRYPNATVVKSTHYTEEGGEGYYLEFSTKDPLLTVIQWYKERLDKQGWNIIYQTEITENPDYHQIEYKKPDIQLDVSAVKQEGSTTRVIITHHKGMGEYGPAVKYE